MPVILHTPPSSSLTSVEIDRWRHVPVTVAVDLGPDTQQIDPAIRPLCPAGQQPRLFGQAVTVRITTPDFGAVLHAIDIIKSGQILVIAAAGDRDTAVIGDILAGHLRRKGVAGLVVDGAVRDAGALASWTDFPVFCRWITPRGPVGANHGVINQPVEIGGCQISPGDLVIGDDDGLVALSPIFVRTRIRDADAKLSIENARIKDLEAGKLVAEVFGLSPLVGD
ncbi:MAG: dimethylmenaquinone methyltransferase [Proteobacteria bacterium]|jgi:4-hydroxy-4-methyl-2-oxoglutarate aldolase|nr:dimethylmenaquinone methyltransferase [Pseudomonadota bacterium]